LGIYEAIFEMKSPRPLTNFRNFGGDEISRKKWKTGNAEKKQSSNNHTKIKPKFENNELEQLN